MTASEGSQRATSAVELLVTAHTAALETAAATTRRAVQFGDRLSEATSVSVGQTPSEVVYTENKLELLHYEPVTAQQHDVPILIVYALINKPFILDLQPDRSVVRRLLEAGHDVYLIDWGEPSRLDSSLRLDDYVGRYLDNCVDEVRRRSGQDAINLLGYCMGGTMSAMYAALNPGKVNALGLLAAGLYFEESGGVLEFWGDEEYFDPRELARTYGNVPAEFLEAGFALMDPVANYLTKYVNLFDRLENEDFVENFARMETWIHDGVDVAGQAYAEFVEAIYQENRLYANELVVDGQRVDLSNLDMPMLQILGEYDHLVPPEASTPFNDVVASDEVTTIEYPTGHVGLAMSTSSHRDVWPEVAEWFADHAGTPALADVIGEGVEESLGVDIETDITVGNADEIELTIADDSGELGRDVIAREPAAIEAFLEETLGIDIGLEVRDDGIAVRVETDEGSTTTTVADVGAAIRTEVEEAIAEVNLASRYDLDEVKGIGPTYAGRLEAAGIETVSALAEADPAVVAETCGTSESMARDWISRARQLTDRE